jgi:hypothetical protein
MPLFAVATAQALGEPVVDIRGQLNQRPPKKIEFVGGQVNRDG